MPEKKDPLAGVLRKLSRLPAGCVRLVPSPEGGAEIVVAPEASSAVREGDLDDLLIEFEELSPQERREVLHRWQGEEPPEPPDEANREATLSEPAEEEEETPGVEFVAYTCLPEDGQLDIWGTLVPEEKADPLCRALNRAVVRKLEGASSHQDFLKQAMEVASQFRHTAFVFYRGEETLAVVHRVPMGRVRSLLEERTDRIYLLEGNELKRYERPTVEREVSDARYEFPAPASRRRTERSARTPRGRRLSGYTP